MFEKVETKNNELYRAVEIHGQREGEETSCRLTVRDSYRESTYNTLDVH